VLDTAARTVRFARRGMLVDLGAAGKGYAVDVAIESLRANGIASAFLHGGTSSVRAIGAPSAADGWRVGWKADGAPGRTFALRDSALGVSAVHGKAFRVGDRVYGHVIDPRTGRPASVAGSAAVSGPRAFECDALSTALLVRGAGWLPELGASFAGYDGAIA
jgi:thiamine biosynthesis lipoprotein